MERKLFTALQGDLAESLNNSLSKQGFRRSQNVLYRPSCSECNACMSARIRVADFVPSRSQYRVLRNNSEMIRRPTSPWATEEQFELFRRYLDHRHATGGMADMDLFEFAAMVEETPIRSRLIEYRGKRDGDTSTNLHGVSLTDILDDGLSMVYSFFDPTLEKHSLGTYVILDHIEIAREMGLPYVYLGYWVPGSRKMGYKANFSALEVYFGGGWQAVKDKIDFAKATQIKIAEPIAEQVAKIQLPQLRSGEAI